MRTWRRNDGALRRGVKGWSECRQAARTGAILLSDGADNASKHKLAQLMKMAEQSSTLIYAVGIFDEDDPDGNPGVLRRLAGVTGGEAYFPSVKDPVIAVCERIARDIRNQYTIGYVSSNVARPGAYRAIRVVAGGTADGKLLVRARSGSSPAANRLPENREIEMRSGCGSTAMEDFAVGPVGTGAGAS